MLQGTRSYTIQIGAYAARSLAESLLARMQAKGYAVDMTADPDASGKQLFKVRLGQYASRAEATQAAVAFHQKEKLPYFITKSGIDTAAGPASRTAPAKKTMPTALRRRQSRFLDRMRPATGRSPSPTWWPRPTGQTPPFAKPVEKWRAV